MSISAKLMRTKTEFDAGSITLNDILLHVEPLLMQAVHNSEDETEVKKLVNDIERAIFTQEEPQKSRLVSQVIERGISFVRNREGAKKET